MFTQEAEVLIEDVRINIYSLSAAVLQRLVLDLADGQMHISGLE